MEQDIGLLPIGARAFNCLRSENINTIGELLQKTRADLLRIKNMGKVSVNEIACELKKIGVDLESVRARPQPPPLLHFPPQGIR